MTSNYDFLKHTDLFKKDGTIKEIKQISEGKIRVRTDDGKFYVISLYDIDKHKDISEESFIQERLRDIGIDSLRIYEQGIFPDLKKSYKIFQYRDEQSLKDFLSKASEEDEFRIGFNFGQILKKFHQTSTDILVDWEKDFTTKANYLFYMHGISDKKTEKDYIYIDHIKDNIHLSKNTTNNLIHGNINDKNIRVYGNLNLDLRGIKEIKLGDGIFDFVDINKLAITHPVFARGVVEAYFDGQRPSRKFFRLLSLYQAYVILYNQVNENEDKPHFLDGKERSRILEMYDYFNQLVPNWIS
ncbi:MAG: kanamycin kinase [Anaerococcus sp.]|nr:kanamycin kinase [Anaerococcus sp.]